MIMLAGIMSACINEGDLYEAPDVKEIVGKFVMTEKFEVPVQEGYYTVVKLGEDTLYYGNVATIIDVPKFVSTTRAVDDLKWYYVVERPAGVEPDDWYYKVCRYGLLVFEDMLQGDNDYNDFICGLIEEIQFDRTSAGWNVGLSNIRLKPLAMGNTLPLKFGVEFRDVSTGTIFLDQLITDNVRRDFFANKTGFINTTPEGTLISLGELTERPFPTGAQIAQRLVDNQLCILWYIEADGMKRYVADAYSNLLTQDILGESMLMQNRVPFGLFIPQCSIEQWGWNGISFRWPLEKKSIFTVYPNFSKWVNGEVDNPFDGPNTSLLFNQSLMGL